MRLVTKAAIGGAGVVGAAALLPTLNNRRWSRSPDATGGDPLGLPEVESTVVTTADGADLQLYRHGSADPDAPLVVLPHCWTGDHRIWAPVVRRLAPDHRVVLYDQRGHGRSTMGSAGVTIAAIADDLAAVLHEVDAHGAVVAGHSMGGMCTQAFAVHHRDDALDRVRHMVLVATAAQNNDSPLAAFEGLIDKVMANDRLTKAMLSDRLSAGMVRGVFGRQPSLAQMRATALTFGNTAGRVRADTLAALATLDLSATLHEVEIPASILVGSRDTLTPPAKARQMHRLLPNSTLEVLAGFGHMLPLEAPDAVAAAIRQAAAAPAAAPAAAASPA